MKGLGAFFQLELADALRSRWVAFVAGVYAIVFGSFVAIGLRESSMLGFTGLSRVVLNLSTAVVLAIPLLALVATVTVVPRARASGLFEVLLVQPVGRRSWLFALLASRMLVLLAPLALLLVVVVAFGVRAGESSALVVEALRTIAIASSLVVAYAGVGLAIGTVATTAEKAVVFGLVVWVLGAAVHDLALLGVLLRWQLPPVAVFSLAAANPMEAARIGILAGVDPDLSLLGPVGFWIANDLGALRAFLFGASWPLAIGVIATAVAAARFEHADLVA